MPKDKPAYPVAMQVRCPKCGREQYGSNVYDFSHARSGCSSCGEYTQVITIAEYEKRGNE